MHWWCLLIMIMAFMAFMADLDMTQFAAAPVVPSLAGGSPSVLTLALFLIVLGMLFRILKKERKGEKEELREQVEKMQERIEELEGEK